jgi:hypothetical protein
VLLARRAIEVYAASLEGMGYWTCYHVSSLIVRPTLVLRKAVEERM